LTFFVSVTWQFHSSGHILISLLQWLTFYPYKYRMGAECMPLDCKPFAAPDGQNECQTACN